MKARRTRRPGWLTRPDLPTYLGGWIATLAWLAVVGSTVGDAPFNLLIGVLTTCGFVVSFWLRGYWDTPSWALVKGLLLAPGTALRIAFLALCVIPGLQGKAPFSRLIPNLAFGTDEWLIGTGFMWGMAVYSFGLVSDGLVAFGSVMGLAMLGLMASVNVNPELGIAFMVFLLGNLLLLGNLSLAPLAPPQVSRERQPALRWCVDQVLVAALTVTVTSTFAIGLAWVLQRVSPAGLVPIGRLSAMMTPGGLGNIGAGYASFSDQMQVGIGSQFSEPSPVLFEAEAPQPMLWRRLVYDTFSGRVWRFQSLLTRRANTLDGPPGTTIADNLAGSATAGASRLVRTTVTYHQITGLSAPAQLVHITRLQGDPREVQMRTDSYGNVSAAIDAGTVLEMQSMVPEPTPAQLAAAPRADPGQWPTYLRIPPSALLAVSAASREILPQLTARDPYTIARGIQDWLEREFVYDAAYTAPAHINPVEHYLEHRRGACDMIATVMALVARYNQIPARVAVGFGPGEPTGPDHWEIRLRDAHAWAELYFPGYGWIAFNPAVAAPEEATDDDALEISLGGLSLTPQSLARTAVSLMALWLAGHIIRALWRRRRPWRTVAWPFGSRRGRRQHRGRPGDIPGEAILLAYYRALRLLTRRGYPRRRTETARAYLHRLQQTAAPAPWLPPLERLTRQYEAVRYTGQQPTPDDLAAAAGHLATLRKTLRRPKRDSQRGRRGTPGE